MMRQQRRRTTAVLLLPLLVIGVTVFGPNNSSIVRAQQQQQQDVIVASTTSAISQEEQRQDIRDTTDIQPGEQRRELFWSLVFLMELLKDPPCPPIGPLHDKCKARKEANAANDSSSSSSSSTYSASESVSDSTGSSNGIQTGSSKMKLWMFIVAAAAMTMAFIAAVIGQRRQNARNTHILTGSVARRMGLFQTFCDSTLCADERNTSRVVEMTMSMDDYDAIPDHNNHRNSAMV